MRVNSIGCASRTLIGTALGNHFKSGQRLSLQNRPTEGARNLDILPRHPLFRQVLICNDLSSPSISSEDFLLGLRVPDYLDWFAVPHSQVERAAARYELLLMSGIGESQESIAPRLFHLESHCVG